MTPQDETLEMLRSANPIPGLEHLDKREMQNFLSELDERRSLMTLTDTRSRSPSTPPQRSRRRSAIAFALAAAVVIAAIGGIALLVASDNDPNPPASEVAQPVPQNPAPPPPVRVTVPPSLAPPMTAAPTTTIAATVVTEPVTTLPTAPGGPVPVPAPSVNLSGYEWTSVWGPADRANIYGVQALDEGFIAVGMHVGAHGDQSAAVVYHSVDGTAWQKVTDFDPDDPRGEWLLMEAVTDGPDGYVAMGKQVNEECMAAWTSSDGLAWRRAPRQTAFGDCGDDLFVTDVAASARRYVAVGSRFTEGDWPGTLRAVVWTSSDGRRWSRLPSTEGVLRIEGLGLMMHSVTYGDEGFVAVGAECVDAISTVDACLNETTRETDGAIWWSRTGTEWDRIDLEGSPLAGGGQQELRSVTYGPEGYLAVGSVTNGADVWMSQDGREWAPVETTIGTLVAAAAGESRYAAASKSTVWTSVDGTSWHEVAIGDVLSPSATAISGIAASDHGLVVVACSADDWGGCTWVWFAGPAHPPDGDPGVLDEFDRGLGDQASRSG